MRDFYNFSKLILNVVEDSKQDCSEDDSIESLFPSNFALCSTDFERVKSLMTLPGIREFRLSKDTAKVGGKSDSKAKEARNTGNTAWRSGKVDEALGAYNKAVLAAESNEERALAYANRSCVLYRLKRHSSVVQDIECAIKNTRCTTFSPLVQCNYPTGVKRARLLARLGQSFLGLRRFDEAANALKKATSQLGDDGDQQLSTLIESCLAEVEQGRLDASKDRKAVSPIVHYESPHTTSPQPTGNETFELIDTGDTVGGWQLVAKRDLKPGELILIDQPYARHVDRDECLNHCYTCFRFVANPYPCRGCCQIVFCSPDCESAAWSSPGSGGFAGSNPIHAYECTQLHRLASLDDYAGWKRLYNSSIETSSFSPVEQRASKVLKSQLTDDSDRLIGGPNIAWLAFACLARTPLPTLIECCSQSSIPAFSGHRSLPSTGSADDWNALKQSPTHRYNSIAWLCTNSNKRPSGDLWQRTVAAVFLTHCLSTGGYPIDWDPSNCLKEPSPDTDPSLRGIPASWVAACLLNHIQAISSNAYLASFNRHDFTPDDPSSYGVNLEGVDLVDVGHCFFPLLSLANHSCDPNTALVYSPNGQCAMFALRSIATKEALFTNYGPHYATSDRAIGRRHKLVAQYFFHCQCRACEDDWRLSLSSMTESRIRCPNCISPFECNCPSYLKRKQAVLAWTRDATVSMTNLTNKLSRHSFHTLPPTLLDSSIEKLSNSLATPSIESSIQQPHYVFDWIKEGLKLLLSLRFGYWFAKEK